MSSVYYQRIHEWPEGQARPGLLSESKDLRRGEGGRVGIMTLEGWTGIQSILCDNAN